MQYYNPYRIFQINPERLDATTLQNLNERLSNIYRTNSTYETINYDGTKITVQDLKKCYNELNDPESATFHKQILKKTELFNFLEYGHPSYLNNLSFENEDLALFGFLLPYFATQYSESLIQAIKSNDKENIKFLSELNLPMMEGNEELYFQDVNDYLKQSVGDLFNLRENNKLSVMSEREIAFQLPDVQIQIFNSLPKQFEDFRNSIANQTRLTAEKLTLEHDRRDGAVALINQTLKLNLSDFIRKELLGLKKQLNPGFSKIPLFVIIGLSVVGLLFLLKWIENTFF
jgi:hypothetical protein